MKVIIFLFIASIAYQSIAQDNHQSEVEAFQKKMNKKFKNPKQSPLPEKEIADFKGLDYFPIDEHYSVFAKFIRYDNPGITKIKTSTKRIAYYYKYAKLEFTLDSQTHQLNVYQSSKNFDSNKKRLFLLFTDLTNGKESYAGGRYINLTIPDGDEIILDFNKSYNPYCAYNYNYSCPIPPAENHLEVSIKAGVKKAPKH
ncbi:MAG: DUF1684 domain-containing protein [Psychroflexus sp.]|nr:DUF1684 domain-containing protein [Psychroflexus sp.]MDR9448659.1 DUF1684 domain-containing protein [Psychroflexus sp.]